LQNISTENSSSKPTPEDLLKQDIKEVLGVLAIQFVGEEVVDDFVKIISSFVSRKIEQRRPVL